MLSRRRFLQSLAASTTLAAPFVRTLGGVAHASDAGQATRLIVFFTPNGIIHDRWRPVGGEHDFAFPTGSMLEPLASHRDQLVVVDGVDFFNVTNHEGGMASMLTGCPGTATEGMSIDQYIARELGAETPFSSLELGVISQAWGVNSQTVMCYGPGGTMVPPDDDPTSVYRRIFGDAGGAEPDARALRQASILDLNRDELRALRDRVGSEERTKFDQHLEAVRTVERRLGAALGEITCDGPAEAPSVSRWANDQFPVVGRLQTDMMLTALRCGITNVASLQWSHTVGPPVFTWVDEYDVREQHHSLSHWDASNEDGIEQYVACQRWFAGEFAYVLQELADTPEPGADGSMLDHSLVVWAQELGDGRLHECVSVPFVLAGGAGGCLEGGRYLRYDHQPHQKLLVSVAQACGLDIEIFGTAAHGVGGLDGLLS